MTDEQAAYIQFINKGCC